MSFIRFALFSIFVCSAPNLLAELPASVAGFFGPTFDRPKLSPDGAHFAVVRGVNGHDFLEVFRIADSQSVNIFSLEEGRGVFDYDWADASTIMMRVRSGNDFLGAYPTGTLQFNIHDLKSDRLFKKAPHEQMYPDMRLLRYYDYLQMNAFDASGDARVTLSGDAKETFVYRYDLVNERYTELATVPGEVFNTYSDRAGNVLASFGYAPSSSKRNFRDQVQLLIRSDSKDEFRVARTGNRDEIDVYLLADGPRKNTVYVLEDISGDTLALSVLDLASGDIKPILRPARTDVLRTYLDGQRQLYAVGYDDHFPQFHYPNPKHPLAVLHQSFSGHYKNKNVEFTQVAADNSKAVVLVSSDVEPGQYFILDLKTKKLGLLFERAADEAKLPLGPRNPIEFKASDGTRLTGYVTVPNGYTQGRLPMIVLPHDERFAEPYTWGYRQEAQIFASQGFAVLEVNQRGVLGFGRTFFDAGVGQFGGLQLDDIEAGVQFTVAAGTADAGRICIVGRRWGAQVAFMSAIRNRDQYRCVVTVAGQYDISGSRRAIPLGQFRDRFTQRLVGNAGDEAAVDNLSPHLFATQIDTPLLVVEGKQFRQRLSDQASTMVQELRKGDADWQLHEESTTRTNFLLNDLNRASAYARILEFVTRHTQPAG